MEKILTIAILFSGIINCAEVEKPVLAASMDLIESADSNDLKGVQQALKEGANVDYLGEDGTTALMASAVNSDIAMVKILIDAGANINMQNDGGYTALIFASSHGRKEIVELLIKSGSTLNLQNKNGETALMIAAKYGKKDVVKILLEAGTDTTIKNKKRKTFFDHMNGKRDIEKVYKEYLESPVAKAKKAQICKTMATIGKLTPDVENLIGEYCI